MPIIYDADAEQVREETDDPRAMLRPIEVADLLDLHINTVSRLFQDASSLPLNYAAAGVCTKKI